MRADRLRGLHQLALGLRDQLACRGARSVRHLHSSPLHESIVSDAAGNLPGGRPIPDRVNRTEVTVISSHRDHVGGSYPGPYGLVMVISVRARAMDGAATEEVRRALAAAVGVAPTAISLRNGQTSTNKLFTVNPAPDDLDERIKSLLSASGTL
ncbi:MAG: DUF167 family protein [Actinobacteria bacterium]|nr:DUF167 family protein [Actinomycetota bacterium]